MRTAKTKFYNHGWTRMNTDGNRPEDCRTFSRRETDTGLECGNSSPLLRRRLVAVELLTASDLARVPALARAVNAPLPTRDSSNSTATSIWLAPTGRTHTSPGQRPGLALEKRQSPEGAIHFRARPVRRSAPSGLGSVWQSNPGRRFALPWAGMEPPRWG